MERSDFEITISSLRPRVVRQALRYLKDRDEAEDVAQDTLLKLWEIRDTWHQYRSLEALALVMARHLSLNRLRQAGIQTDDVLTEPVDHAETPEERLIAQEDDRQAERLIATLPDAQQTILRMKHIEGMEVSDIARITGSNENAVRVNLSKARRKIASYFNK